MAGNESSPRLDLKSDEAQEVASKVARFLRANTPSLNIIAAHDSLDGRLTIILQNDSGEWYNITGGEW